MRERELYTSEKAVLDRSVAGSRKILATWNNHFYRMIEKWYIHMHPPKLLQRLQRSVARCPEYIPPPPQPIAF